MKRFYEMLPGLMTWATFILIIPLSWLLPAEMAVFVILFDTYWLLKTIYLSIHLRITFSRMRANLKIDWRSKLDELGKPWRDTYHLIMMPMYKEPYEVVQESFAALAKINYPLDRCIVVLALEERAGEEAQETGRKIQAEFGETFFKFLVTTHPKDLPGEIPGKGSNESWAGAEAKRTIIDPLAIPYEQILVSVFDIDTQVSPEYFGILTCHFLTCEHPQRSSFQPIPIFTNNVYESPMLARVIAFSSTFWHMIQQARPHRLTTFSSHSMPFAALAEVGFWTKDVVSEDSHIFWQCYLHFDGDWRVVPINYPVYMDANVAPTFVGTMVNQYKQQRRWAWGGCENIPLMLGGFIGNKRIPLAKRFSWAFHYIEGFHSWATNAVIIFALGWLPILLGGPEFRSSLLSYTLPKASGTIMNIAMLGVIPSAILSIILLPPKPAGFKKRQYFFYIIQWVLIPISMVWFGSIPAIDAQTRGILGGKYRLGFWVTPKHRTKQP